MNNLEVNRARDDYAKRDEEMPPGDRLANIYHPRHPMGQLFHEHNRLVLVQALNDLDIDLGGKKILDLGCGVGAWLRYFIELGSDPKDLVGVDINEQRIKEAQARNPAITWLTFDGCELEFQSQAFDIVIQTVVFSSIHDPLVREQLVTEMWRTLRTGGYLLWLDRCGPSLDHLVGFSPSRVKEYFNDGTLIYSRRVHPGYFRYMYRRFTWLARILSNIVGWGYEAELLVFQKVG